MAADENPAAQMVLPMAEMVGWLRQGVRALIRRARLPYQCSHALVT
jgi:hypothetical protein